MKKSSTIVLTSVLLACFATVSWANGASKVLEDKMQSNFDDIVSLGDMPFLMAEKNGQVFYVSSNGRYVIRGELQDMWSGGEPVTSVAQFRQSSNIVDFDALGLNVSDLFELVYGSGPNDVVLFVSPGCGHCKKTLKQMPGLENQYTFHIIPIPIMGPRSEDALRRLASVAPTRPDAALAALISEDYSQLEIDPNLNAEKIGRSLLTAQVLGINSVPVIVDHKNRMSKGRTESRIGSPSFPIRF